MRGLPAPRILLPVVILEADLLDALVTARALDEVVAALNAGSSVFLIGWLVGLRGFAPALGALGGLFIHQRKNITHLKKHKIFFVFLFFIFVFLCLTSLRENCEIGMGQIVKRGRGRRRKCLVFNSLTYDHEIHFVMIRKRLVFNDLRRAAGRAVVTR